MSPTLKETELAERVGPLCPSRRWDEMPVLAALAAVIIAAVWLGTLVSPRLPGDSSVEAGLARDMSAHHAQGVEMAELVRSRTADDEVRALATDIALTQQAQIGQMAGWLAVWGLSPTRTGLPMAWMGHPTVGPMPGMATSTELEALATGPSAELDVRFLRLMVRHHRGAVLMARGALARSLRPEVATLARAVADGQRAELLAMEAMLVARGAQPVDTAVMMPAAADDGHHGGHSLSAVARQLLRALPIGAGVFAVAWLAIDGARRRRTWAGLAAPVPAVDHGLQWAVALGLAVAGMLHLALAPEHFGEGLFVGLFFVASAVAQLAMAASVVAWPAPRVLVGAGVLNAALCLVYVLFRLVPVPGAEGVEDFDVLGLFTQSLQLATAAACVSAWARTWPLSSNQARP